MSLALLVGETAAEGLEYFVPSLKMWPTSMPRAQIERLAAPRTGIARARLREGGPRRRPSRRAVDEARDVVVAARRRP